MIDLTGCIDQGAVSCLPQYGNTAPAAADIHEKSANGVLSMLDGLEDSYRSARVDAQRSLMSLALRSEKATPGRMLMVTSMMQQVGVTMSACVSLASSFKSALSELRQSG